MTEQTTTPLVVTIRLLVEEDVELLLLLMSVSVVCSLLQHQCRQEYLVLP